jgi:DNA-binding GntR family transcriptional regulator
MNDAAAKTAESTVVDYTIDALREAIRSGRLAPGQRLVVADITAMLSVSAGPVREAIRRLTGEGLIEIVPHRGASVRQITLRDLDEIFELRGAIEGLAARLAAERASEGGFLEELNALMEEMEQFAVSEDVAGYLRNNMAFHDLVYRMSGNDRLRVLAAQLIMPIYQVRLPQRMSRAAMELSYRDHKAIAAALITGNGDAAESAMRLHVAQAGDGLKETLAALTPPARPVRERASTVG